MASSKVRVIELLASAARTATASSEGTAAVENFDEIIVYLDVTAVSGTSPTLDLVYETSPDDGTTWFTHTTFTQVTATGKAIKLITTPGSFARVTGTVGGTTPSFTYSVHMEGKWRGR